MSLVAFVDSNVPIYAAGAEHVYNQPCVRVLTLAAVHPQSYVTDAGVLQEILHRYVAAGQSTLGSKVVSRFAQVMYGRIEPVYESDIRLAAKFADNHPGAGARVLLHSAVMQRLGVDRIVSADAEFDRLPHVTRLDPMRVADWESSILE